MLFAWPIAAKFSLEDGEDGDLKYDISVSFETFPSSQAVATLKVNLIPSYIMTTYFEMNFFCRKGKVLKDLETISKIAGLIHKFLATYNLYKMC